MDRRGRTCQVIDFVYLCVIGESNVVTDKFEIWAAKQMDDVFFPACKIVIQTDNIMTFS